MRIFKALLAACLLSVILVSGNVFLAGPHKDSLISKAYAAKKSVKAQGVISWKDAANYYGQYKTVEGTIVTTYNSGKACFLNYHTNWKKNFTAVIFRSDYNKFPENPEEYYDGKKVRIYGKIKQYQGKPEIILKSPSQIEIIE